jgi:hypothetical protein
MKYKNLTSDDISKKYKGFGISINFPQLLAYLTFRNQCPNVIITQIPKRDLKLPTPVYDLMVVHGCAV